MDIKHKLFYCVFTLFLVSLIPACETDNSGEEVQLLILGSALTKLSASVEATVRYKNPNAELTEQELLLLATEHDPSLLVPFENYALRVHRENRHAIVLVCSKDQSQRLLEDAGCSAEMDVHRWRKQENTACVFTVELATACAVSPVQ